MGATLTATLQLKITDGVDAKLAMAVPLAGIGGVSELRDVAQQQVSAQVDSLVDALQEQMKLAAQPMGSLWPKDTTVTISAAKS